MSKFMKPASFGASAYLEYKGGVIWYECAGKFHARASGNLGVFRTAAAAKAAISKDATPLRARLCTPMPIAAAAELL